MTQSLPKTLGALKQSPYGMPERARRGVKDEMRQNLLTRLCTSAPLFAGVIGYEDSVMPQIANAILSRHNFILLGLRGQAKTRLLRALTELLDDSVPVIQGCEIHDDPLAPLCAACRARVASEGDDLPIAWRTRERLTGTILFMGKIVRMPA